MSEIIGEGRGRKKLFADELELSQASISQYLSGKITPPVKTVIRFAEIDNISLDWLLTGRGFKYRLLQEKRGIRHAEDGTVSVPLLDDEGNALSRVSLEPNEGAPTRIPILGKVPAGKPGDGGRRWSQYDAPDFIERHLSSDDPDLIALAVSGESMFPTLYPDDHVIVSPNAAWDAGDMVVVEIDDYNEDYLVKRLGPTVGDRVMLFSDNWICYEPMEVEVDRTNVRGRVLGIYRTPSRRQDPQMYGDAGIVEYHRDPAVQKIIELLPTLDEGHRQAIIEMIRSLNKAVGKEL